MQYVACLSLADGNGYDAYPSNSISSYNPSDINYSQMQNYQPYDSAPADNPYGRNPMLDTDVPLGDGMSVAPSLGVEAWKTDEDAIGSRYLDNFGQKQRPFSFINNVVPAQQESESSSIENADNRQVDETGSESTNAGR